MVPQKLKRVGLHKLQAVLAGEALAQACDEPLVLFNSQDMSAGLKEGFGQWSQTGPDLQHGITRGGIRQRQDPPDLVLVVQKILAQRFR